MGFIEDVAGFRAMEKKGKPCPVSIWLANNKDVTHEDLVKLAQSGTYSSIHDAMRKRGYTSDTQSVSKHIRGVCQCSRMK